MSRARPEQLAPQSGPFADVLVREDPDDEEEEEKHDEAVSIRHFHRRQRFGVQDLAFTNGHRGDLLLASGLGRLKSDAALITGIARFM